jgi:predicted MFS family arabinose efflux permease
MAVIAASGVAVIYIPQPIQTLVAEEFGIPIDASAAATTAVQAGYAVGIVFLVSLGDRFAARSQVTLQLLATAVALVGAALAPAYAFYVVMCFVAGSTATIGQLLVAAALRLAPPAVRARTAAVLLGSFIVGLFTVRTALGSLAEILGWRGAVAVSAVLMLALVPLALRFAPRDRPVDPPGYRRILASIPGIIRESATLRLMSAMHVLCFAAFIAVWATTTVHAVDELGLSVTAASLIGLAGLVGGLATIGVAPLHAVVGARRSVAVSIGALLVGTTAIAIAPQALPVTVVALFLISFGMSSEQVTAQARALASVLPAQSGRANTVFMAVTFLGGAIATAVAERVYGWAGFGAVGAMATVMTVGAVVLAVVSVRRGML